MTSRPERGMLGLDFVLASSARNASETGACSWGDGHANRANRESSASSFFYGNGGTKFRKFEILCSARWAALLTIQHRLRRGFDRKKRSQNPNACYMSARETNIDAAASSGYRMRLNSSGRSELPGLLRILGSRQTRCHRNNAVAFVCY
jgi:hypothetical protein